jgi:hypothetical protein
VYDSAREPEPSAVVLNDASCYHVRILDSPPGYTRLFLSGPTKSAFRVGRFSGVRATFLKASFLSEPARCGEPRRCLASFLEWSRLRVTLHHASCGPPASVHKIEVDPDPERW